jgi:hypothetical protein
MLRTGLETMKFHAPARVAKLADAWDLKSLGEQSLCGFDSRPEHRPVRIQHEAASSWHS